MTDTVTFGALLELASKGKGADISKLEERKAVLEARKAKLQAELGKVNEELGEIEAQLQAPIKAAIKAARELQIEVPAQYLRNGNGKGDCPRSQGKYLWEVSGQVPFRAEVSRAMWRLSRGSGGSAGRNNEGILTAAEFWQLLGLKEEQLAVGERKTLVLPNGKTVVFQRLE